MARSLIILAALCCVLADLKTTYAKEHLNITDLLQGKYSPKFVVGSWVSELEYLFMNPTGDIVLLDVSNNVESILIQHEELGQYLGAKVLSRSPDEQFILFSWATERYYFASTQSYYTLFEMNTREFTNVVLPDGSFQKLLGFTWSGKESSFAFVYNNNVYYGPSANLQQRPPVQVTFDGQLDGPIYNAMPDYEYDQITTFDDGLKDIFRFSPDATILLFIQYNDTGVDQVQVPDYGDASMQDTTYPKWRKHHWAKPGRPIPVLSAFTLDLTLPDSEIPSSLTKVSYAVDGNLEYHDRFSLPNWVSNTSYIATWVDRSYHNFVTYNCSTLTTPSCTKLRLLQIPFEKMAPGSEIIYSKVSKSYIQRSPYQVAESFKWLQVSLMNMETFQEEAVTLQEFTVKKLIGWDQTNGKIYFYATGFDESENPDLSDHHAYEVSIEGDLPAQSNCLTCNIVNSESEKCRSNKVSFSRDYSYFVHTCEGPGVPETVIRSNQEGYNTVNILETNEELKERLDNLWLPGIQEYTIPLPDSPYVARVMLRIPPNFDPSGNTKYPLLVDTYPNPIWPSIHRRFTMGFGNVISGSNDVVVALIDGRSTIDSPWDGQETIYMDMAGLEFDDQLTATKWLVENLQFIDSENTAIWGESYGGYATFGILARDSENIIKCGVPVASCTTAYHFGSLNEGFLGGPPNNFTREAYAKSEVWVNGVENFKNKNLLVLHSDSDMQGHFINSMLMIRELQKQNIQFRMMIYPNAGHMIPKPEDFFHIWRHYLTTLETFLLEDCYVNPTQGKL